MFGKKKYSKRWFKSISDDELRSEREPLRLKSCKGDEFAKSLLDLFDKEGVKRLNKKYEKEHPNSKPRHREHGWYLPNDD